MVEEELADDPEPELEPELEELSFVVVELEECISNPNIAGMRVRVVPKAVLAAEGTSVIERLVTLLDSE